MNLVRCVCRQSSPFLLALLGVLAMPGAAQAAFAEDEPFAEASHEPTDAQLAAHASVEASSAFSARRAPNVAIVVLSNREGKAFDAFVEKRLIPTFGRAAHAVPMRAVHAAIRRIRPTSAAQLHFPATLLRIGRELDVPFVLVVEATGTGRGRRVFAGLVDVAQDTTILARREPTVGGRIDAALARKLGARIRYALAKREPVVPAGATPAPRPTPRPHPKTGDAPWAPVDQPPHRAADPAAPAEEPEEAALDAQGRDLQPAKHKHQDEEADPEDEKIPSDDDEDEVQTSTDAGKKAARVLLPRGRFGVGLQMAQRVSKLKAASVGGVAPPCYCGNGNNSQPFFPAVTLGGEITSGAFTGHSNRYKDGFGLRANLLFAPVSTRVVQASGSHMLRSTVLGWDLTAFYRLPFLPGRVLTPDVRFGVGFQQFRFPLAATQYPSLAWQSPMIDVGLDVPLHRNLGLHAEVSVMPGLSAGKQATAMLGKPKTGLGFAAGGGLHAGFSYFGFDATVQYERFSLPFTGTTALPNTGTTSDGSALQFHNVTLSDQLLSILIRASVAF